MRIKMLRGAVGSPDGMNVYGYEKDETYTASDPLDHATRPLPMSRQLALLFVAEGWAVEVDAEKVVSAAPSEPAQAEASTQAE